MRTGQLFEDGQVSPSMLDADYSFRGKNWTLRSGVQRASDWTGGQTFFSELGKAKTLCRTLALNSTTLIAKDTLQKRVTFFIMV